MALVLSGSIDISGSMTATTILISSPGAAGMVSSSAQITELAPLMAYTASLKGAAIVSSSQQVQNYFTFAKTGSANTFYGNQTITGSLFISGSGAAPGQSIQIIKDTLGNGTTVEEINMAVTILSAPGQTKLAMGASNAGNYGYIQVMQEGVSWTNRSLTLQPRGGDVTITNGNLVMGTSGKGIDFSANSNNAGMTSELLNDYEEGTWTPVIEGETTNPTLTGYSTQVGRYTKIGRLVTVHCALQPAGTSVAGTGNLRFGGLPFTSANITDVIGTGVSSANGDFAWGSGKTQLVFNVASNSTKIGVWGMQNGTTEAGIPVNNFNNSAQYLLLSITYMAAT